MFASLNPEEQARVLIDEQLVLVEGLWALNLEDVRLLSVDDQGALPIVDEGDASHLDSSHGLGLV